MARLPFPDVARLADVEPLYAPVEELPEVWWRIYATAGAHPTRWNELRTYGPIGSRFDPHEPPPHVQAEGVMYVAGDLATALAEVYQSNRIINRARDAAHLMAFTAVRNLRLLDLTGGWPLRIGASHTINTGRKDRTRAWARALRMRWPDADGLLHTSALTGAPAATLWNPAASALPVNASFSYPLTHPGLEDRLLYAAEEIGYRLR